MGETPILLNTIFQEIGIETVAPPPITQETIVIGAKHAPELACFPFKVCLGSYIQAVRSGADTILMAGGCGPCRFGVYAEVQRSIMRSLGYNVDFIILEPLACMMSAVSKLRCSMPGTKVCVIGCGYMGCGVISLLKLRGMFVVGVDIRKESLADAKRYGADEIYTAGEILSHYPNGSFEFVMEWGETNESLDLAINLTKQCGQLCIGAYHTGGKRLVDVQQLNLKAIDCLSVHPREYDLSAAGARNASQMLASGVWKFVNLPVKIYPMGKFDLAHGEIESKYGKYMKAIIDMTQLDGEPYIK
jgi:D-arabinose 1-dehydrogenase-like Zn-dependent alcohol dehydrogenase